MVRITQVYFVAFQKQTRQVSKLDIADENEKRITRVGIAGVMEIQGADRKSENHKR